MLRAWRIIGTDLRVCEIGVRHLADIERALTKTHSPTTVRDTIVTLQAVFSWAIRYQLLDAIPLLGYRTPSGRERSRVITQDEFQALLRASDLGFRRLLIAAREINNASSNASQQNVPSSVLLKRQLNT